jgi:DNA-binding NarL/FixJ family response regulator
MRLMIVDDHAGMRAMIRHFTGSPGDVICECSNGADAVAQAREFGPDLVTMDLRMPGIGGFEATRALVAALPSATVVVVSSFDTPELRRAAASSGAKGFIAKDNLHSLKGFSLPYRGGASGFL